MFESNLFGQRHIVWHSSGCSSGNCGMCFCCIQDRDKRIKEMERIIIVDKNDNVVGHKDRGTLNEEDIYRVSALWITNSKKEILLARRHKNKSHHPRRWGPAVAGTVDEGESYKENIIKEAEEELGLKNIDPAIGLKREAKEKYHHFTQWYTMVLDEDISYFKIQEDEVEEIKWWAKEDLKTELEAHPENFLPQMKYYLDIF